MLDLFTEADEAPSLPVALATPNRQPLRRWTEVVSMKGYATVTYHRAIWPNGVMTEERETADLTPPKKEIPTEVGLW